jgi:hypothetical protein
MNLRLRKDPWRLMVAVTVAVVIGVFLYKLTREPYVPYIHLLVDYHFGFTKRALIGALVALFFSKVPVWLVFALSGTVWLVTLALFIQLFRRTFAFDHEHLPLFVFMAGSPFFLKNFMHTLGHFDIYGCVLALLLLLIPARSIVFVLLATFASIILILIHHIQFLMYVPTIGVIVVLRYYLVQGLTGRNVLVGAVATIALLVLFLAAQFWGSMAIPETAFVAYLQTRMVDPGRTNLLSFSYIWYRTLADEIQETWQRLPSNLLGVPVFALLIWLHAPLWKYFADLIHTLSDQWHRRVVIAGIVAVTLSYLVMFAIVFDYSRWVSNWVVCMFLILHAVKKLPSAKPVPPISSRDGKTSVLGWLVTFIPRVGIIRPF